MTRLCFSSAKKTLSLLDKSRLYRGASLGLGGALGGKKAREWGALSQAAVDL